MSNWIEERIARNEKIAGRILPELTRFKNKYPKEKKHIDPIIEKVKQGIFDDSIFLEIRNTLRQTITKDEYNLIQKKDFIWEINNILSEIEKENSSEEPEKTDHFPNGFEFKTGKKYYYLRLPKLNVTIDQNEKTELMQDRYIRDFISNSIADMKKDNTELEMFEKYTLIFLHHLRPENASKYDTDNIEIKKPIDGINGTLITNDTAIRSDICQFVIPDDEEYTELYVIKGHALSSSVTNQLKGLK